MCMCFGELFLLYYILNLVPALQLLCWSPNLNVIAFEDRFCEAEIKVNEVLRVGNSSRRTNALLRSEALHQGSLVHVTIPGEGSCLQGRCYIGQDLELWFLSFWHCEKSISVEATQCVVFYYGSPRHVFQYTNRAKDSSNK